MERTDKERIDFLETMTRYDGDMALCYVVARLDSPLFDVVRMGDDGEPSVVAAQLTFRAAVDFLIEAERALEEKRPPVDSLTDS